MKGPATFTREITFSSSPDEITAELKILHQAATAMHAARRERMGTVSERQIIYEQSHETRGEPFYRGHIVRGLKRRIFECALESLLSLARMRDIERVIPLNSPVRARPRGMYYLHYHSSALSVQNSLRLNVAGHWPVHESGVGTPIAGRVVL